MINVYSEIAGWTAPRALRKADEIYETMLGVFEIAREQKIPTYLAADRLAERRLNAVGESGAHLAAMAAQELTRDRRGAGDRAAGHALPRLRAREYVRRDTPLRPVPTLHSWTDV